MRVAHLFIVLSLAWIAACGGARTTTVADGSAPVLLSATPLTVSRGSLVTLSGSGFSVVPQENVVLLGGNASIASDYAVTASGESITFMIPSNAALGDQNVSVMVEGFADALSNALPLTITP